MLYFQLLFKHTYIFNNYCNVFKEVSCDKIICFIVGRHEELHCIRQTIKGTSDREKLFLFQVSL